MSTSMQSEFKWSRRFRSLAHKQHPMRGVHPTLTRLFYPAYDYKRLAFGPTTASATTTTSASSAGRLTKHRPGMRAGILVDNELKRTIQLRAKHNLSSVVFTSFAAQTKFKASHKASQLTPRDLSLVGKRLSPAVYRLWQTFHRTNLVPIASQVPVGCLQMRVATPIDVVCRDSQRRHVVVEIKTGFAGYYHRHTGIPMKHLAPAVADSAANQHQLQLLLNLQLYRITFPAHRVANPVVLRVDALGVDVLPLQDWAKKAWTKIHPLLVASR
jgi:hypothetical protein